MCGLQFFFLGGGRIGLPVSFRVKADWFCVATFSRPPKRGEVGQEPGGKGIAVSYKDFYH